MALTPRILTPFNFLVGMEDMYISLHNKGMYMVIMGREVKPQQYIENSKHLNNIDESFGYMCIHISMEFLFHIYGLKTSK